MLSFTAEVIAIILEHDEELTRRVFEESDVSLNLGSLANAIVRDPDNVTNLDDYVEMAIKSMLVLA